MPGRTHHSAVALGSGLVLLYGGSDGAAPLADPAPMGFSPLLSDPGGFVPVARPSNPARAGPRVGAASALLPDGAVLLSGGTGQRPGDDPAVLFAPQAGQDSASTALFQGTWVPTSAGAARGFGSAAVLPDRAVLLAGGGADGGVAGAEVYVPCADAAAACPF